MEEELEWDKAGFSTLLLAPAIRSSCSKVMASHIYTFHGTFHILFSPNHLSKTEAELKRDTAGCTGQKKQLSLPDNSTILLDDHDHASSSDADTDSAASTPKN